MSSPPPDSPSSDTQFEFWEDVGYFNSIINTMQLDMLGWRHAAGIAGEPVLTDLLSLIEVCSLYMSTLRCEMTTMTNGAGPRRGREEFMDETVKMFDTMYPEYIIMFHTLYPRYMILRPGPSNWTEF
jgi:hypothetical protein